MPPWGLPVAFNLPRQNLVSYSFPSIQTEQKKENTMTKGKKQLDTPKRCHIEFGLATSQSARTIANDIGVSLSTVTREIRKHTYESFKGCYGRTNQCINRADCKLSGSVTFSRFTFPKRPYPQLPEFRPLLRFPLLF